MVDKVSYVDVNTFVCWLGNHPSFGEAAYKWIKKVENAPRGEYVTSSLTLYEALTIIAGLTGKNLKDKQLVEGVVSSMTSLKGLLIEPLKPEGFTQAINQMMEYGIDYEDALHLTVALRKGVKEIVSNDEDFDKTSLTRTF